MKHARPLEVTTPSDREIVMTRTFNAPRHLVFDAWTKPDLLKRWYGARGWNLTVCKVDLRIGGRWRFVSRGPAGDEMEQRGVYREIEPGRLVYTESFVDQSYPGESTVTHELAERHGKTTVTSTIRYPSREARDLTLRYPMTRGLTEAYERLDGVLATLLKGSALGRTDPEHHNPEGDTA